MWGLGHKRPGRDQRQPLHEAVPIGEGAGGQSGSGRGMEAVGALTGDVKLDMVEKNPQRCHSVELSASDRPILGFFDTKQLRKAKRSPGKNLYQWFHVSQVPATKQKYVIINYTTGSEDEEEDEVDPMTGVGGQRGNSLHHKCRSFDVLYHASDPESDYLEPAGHLSHSSKNEPRVAARRPEWREDATVLESDGFESCRSTPFPEPQFVPASEFNRGGCAANQAADKNNFSPAPEVSTFLSISDYVCKPAYGDAKDRGGGKYFAKRGIYATEKDVSEPPELSLMQEHLQQLVAPTAENSNQEEPLDPQVAEIRPSAPEPASTRREMVEGSRKISGGLPSDHLHGQQAQRWDRQRGTYPHQKVANGPISKATVHAEETGREQSYLPLPEKQSMATEGSRAQELFAKKDNVSKDVDGSGNGVDRRDKGWAGKSARPNEANFQQPPPELSVSAPFANPVPSAEGNGKCRPNRHEPVARVSHLHGEMVGGGEDNWVKVDAGGREEPSYQRSGEKMKPNISPERNGSSAEAGTRATSGDLADQGQVDNAHPLGSNARRFLSDPSDGQARRSIPPERSKQTPSSPAAQAMGMGMGRKVPPRKSGETFHGLKKILEKKMDLNYAVLVWKDYYERKRKKDTDAKDRGVQKPASLARSVGPSQLATAAPETKPPAPPSVGPSPPKGGSVDSQVGSDWSPSFKKYLDGLTRGPSGEVYPTRAAFSREGRDEAGPGETLEQDPSSCQGKNISRSQDAGASLAPPNPGPPDAGNETRCFSPDSVASEISLDFYMPLCNPPADAKRCLEKVEVKRAVVADYRPPRFPGQHKKASCDEPARPAPKREQGLKELGGRIFTRISSRASRTTGEGQPALAPDHGTSRVGRCPHRAHLQPWSKSSRGLGAPACPRAERPAPRQTPEEEMPPRRGRSSSRSKDISISLRRSGAQGSPDCRGHRSKEGRSASLTKRSNSRKRSSSRGLVDIRTSHSRACEDARHKLRSSGRCLK